MKHFALPALILWPALAALAADPAPATQPLPGRVELEGRTRLSFSTAGGRLALSSLRDAGTTEWMAAPSQKAALWRLSVRGPQTAAAELSSETATLCVARGDGRHAGFSWTTTLGDQPAKVRLRVRTTSDGLTSWQLDAELPNGWTVVRADWPALADIGMTEGLKLAAPFGWGTESLVEEGLSYEGTYPSLVVAMPFVSLYRNGKGLYIGMHDQMGHHKRLTVKARDKAVAVTCTHVPAEADTVGGIYRPGFKVLIGAFDGDYWEAARIYRGYTRGTAWGRATQPSTGDPAQRAPQWLRDIDLWLMPPAEPLKNVEACRKAGEFFGVPIALHWYNWHQIPFDTLYPEYFPAKPGFAEGVKALQAAGFRVMPYINGRLCDPKSATWAQGGEAAAARDEQGKPYTEVYGSKVPLNVMCPGTKFWQDKVTGLVDRLVNECGVDGVYVDQITAAHAATCSRADHGHSPGGGGFWTAGYRRMLDKVRARLPKDRILTSEENAECWNDQFDALLMVNTPAAGNRRPIPLMPTVYAGRVITFGFQYMAADDVSRSLPFRAKMARAFLWGAQLGWINVDMIMADGAKKEAEFLRNLAKARQGAHAFLLDGEFLGEVEAIGELPRLKGEGSASGGKYPIDLPAMMATAWLARDGKLALAVVNLSDEPRTAEYRVPWHRVIDGAERSNMLPSASRPATVSVTIPPGDARVVTIELAER